MSYDLYWYFAYPILIFLINFSFLIKRKRTLSAVKRSNVQERPLTAEKQKLWAQNANCKSPGTASAINQKFQRNRESEKSRWPSSSKRSKVKTPFKEIKITPRLKP